MIHTNFDLFSSCVQLQKNLDMANHTKSYGNVARKYNTAEFRAGAGRLTPHQREKHRRRCLRCPFKKACYNACL